MSAREASRMLGIRLASLYAYVSRGQIRALPDPADPRARLYRRDDIEALLERKSRQSRPAAAAATALDWGMPVLTTHLSSIGDGRLAYRGRDAVALAETAPLEEIAALLWDCEAVEFRGQIAKPASAAGSPIDRAVAALAGELPAATPTAPAALRGARAGRLIRIIAVAAADRWLADGPLHASIAATWQAPAAADAIRRALVLVADHELNASTFAARVAASTGAPLPHALIAGLVTLAGPAHGGATGRVSALLDEAARLGDGVAAVDARLRRGDDLPGFGHRLYPDGDPRARALMGAFDIAPLERAVAEGAEAMTGLAPTIDFALVALERRFKLPRQAALALFATGRSVGWIAHALEQAGSGQLIRPRAVFSP
ncbi:MAG: citrate synthase family protein [Bosea sp.]|nr:citrate synthase family protein [Bosea sp. (in: a-proteobacteria)]